MSFIQLLMENACLFYKKILLYLYAVPFLLNIQGGVKMTKKVFRCIFIILSIISFIFLVKYFYFDTKMGFNTEILELNYSAFPMWFDVLISVSIMPLLLFAILDDIYDKISNFCLDRFNM